MAEGKYTGTTGGASVMRFSLKNGGTADLKFTETDWTWEETTLAFEDVDSRNGAEGTYGSELWISQQNNLQIRNVFVATDVAFPGSRWGLEPF